MSGNPRDIAKLMQLANLEAPQPCAGGSEDTGYTSTIFWSITGASAGPDIVANTFGAVLLRFVANAANQSPWNFGRNQHGWSIRYSAANAVQMRMQATTGDTTFQYATEAFSGGYACLVWTCRGDGSLWSSYCGEDEHLMVTSPVRTAPDATSVQRIGRIAADIGTLAFAGGVLAVAEGNAALDAATLKAISNCVNERDRYKFNSALRGHANLVSELDFARDWNGSATSVTAGLGSAPRTFAAGSGGGGTKTTIADEIRYFLMRQRAAARNSKRWEIKDTVIRQEAFASRKFDTTATKVIVEFLSQAGGENQHGGFYNAGTEVGKGIASDVVGDSRTIDFSGLGAGNKTIELTDGYQALGTPSSLGVLGEYVRAVRVPATSKIALSTPAAVGRRAVVYGDSIIGHVQTVAVTSVLTSNAYQAWTRIMWGDYPDHAVTVEGYARRTFHDDNDTNDNCDAFADYLISLCDGTSTNDLIYQVGRNDWNFASWGALSSYKTKLKRSVQRVLASSIPGLTLYLQSPTTCTNESNNNAAATPWNIPSQRTMVSDVVTEVADARCIYVNGATLGPTFNAANYPDGLHLSVDGHTLMKPAWKTILGY